MYDARCPSNEERRSCVYVFGVKGARARVRWTEKRWDCTLCMLIVWRNDRTNTNMWTQVCRCTSYILEILRVILRAKLFSPPPPTRGLKTYVGRSGFTWKKYTRSLNRLDFCFIGEKWRFSRKKFNFGSKRCGVTPPGRQRCFYEPVLTV